MSIDEGMHHPPDAEVDRSPNNPCDTVTAYVDRVAFEHGHPAPQLCHCKVIPLRETVVDKDSEVGLVSGVCKYRPNPFVEIIDRDSPGCAHREVFRIAPAPLQRVLHSPSLGFRLRVVKAGGGSD